VRWYDLRIRGRTSAQKSYSHMPDACFTRLTARTRTDHARAKAESAVCITASCAPTAKVMPATGIAQAARTAPSSKTLSFERLGQIITTKTLANACGAKVCMITCGQAHMRSSPRCLRTISASVAKAISRGERAPIGKPIGVFTRAIAYSSSPAASNASTRA
jgi:hypothetical protein